MIPGGILARYADITVKITVGLQKAMRINADSDPKILISDGERGVGFDIRDDKTLRCQGIQGLTSNTLTSLISRGRLSSSSTFSEQFVLTLAPSQLWGSCYSAVDNGLIAPVVYTRYLNLDQGLWLDVYREAYNERYLFNYIIVEIHEN